MLVRDFDRIISFEKAAGDLLAHHPRGLELLETQYRRVMGRIWSFMKNRRQFTSEYDVKAYQEDTALQRAIFNVNKRMRSSGRI